MLVHSNIKFCFVPAGTRDETCAGLSNRCVLARLLLSGLYFTVSLLLCFLQLLEDSWWTPADCKFAW